MCDRNYYNSSVNPSSAYSTLSNYNINPPGFISLPSPSITMVTSFGASGNYNLLHGQFPSGSNYFQVCGAYPFTCGGGEGRCGGPSGPEHGDSPSEQQMYDEIYDKQQKFLSYQRDKAKEGKQDVGSYCIPLEDNSTCNAGLECGGKPGDEVNVMGMTPASLTPDFQGKPYLNPLPQYPNTQIIQMDTCQTPSPSSESFALSGGLPPMEHVFKR